MGLLAALIFPLLLLNYHRTALLTPEHLEVVNRVASAHHGRAALNGIDEPKVLPTFNVTGSDTIELRKLWVEGSSMDSLHAKLGSFDAQDNNVLVTVLGALGPENSDNVKAFRQMALNWLHFVRAADITQYMMFACDVNTRDWLHLHTDARHVHYDPSLARSRTVEDIQKSKFTFLLQTLMHGYSVFVSDVDVVFMKNPFEYVYDDADFQHQMDAFSSQSVEMLDVFEANTGCYYVRATPVAVAFVHKLWQQTMQQGDAGNDQIPFNDQMKRISWPYKYGTFENSLKFRLLDIDRFENGFWFERRGYLNKNTNRLVAVQNNCCPAACKVLQFRASGLWVGGIDDERYYTSGKFLRYTARSAPGQLAEEFDRLQLAVALAVASGRRLVLPEVSCHHINGTNR
jgi:hypothetical protein